MVLQLLDRRFQQGVRKPTPNVWHELTISSIPISDRSRMKGCAFGGVKGRTQLPDLVADYMDGRLKVDEFITHRQVLTGINQAFNDMKKGDCIRCVVDMRKE